MLAYSTSTDMGLTDTENFVKRLGKSEYGRLPNIVELGRQFINIVDFRFLLNLCLL